MKRKCPKCNYGGKNFMMEKCPDGYTTCLKCNYRAKHNEFYVKEVKTTKTKTSIKTLEELGYKKEYEDSKGVRYDSKVFVYDTIGLYHNGSVNFGKDAIIDQEIHKAIEHEMKKRKWWK